MSEANKIQFKVELELYLKSPEDIQKWVLDTLETNLSDELALDVCFLADPQEVIEYFKKIHITDLDINTRNNVIHTLLKKYVLSHITSIRSKEDIYPIAVPQFFTRGSSFELPLVLWVFYRVKIKLLKFFFQTNSLELF